MPPSPEPAARPGAPLLRRCAALDRRWAIALNRGAARPALTATLVAASRLGDGPAWVVLIAVLALWGGPTGLAAALQMLAAGALNLAVYRPLKQSTGRPRPYVACPGIRCGTPPLDAFSFPSGHTLHAVAFTVIAGWHLPLLLVALVPLAALVAASRVVLGLHYPSDVLAGAAIGTASAAGVLLMN